MDGPAAFFTGKLMGEDDLAPLTACLTVITEGSLLGQHGFVRVDGDHEVRHDGTFESPPLRPGRYFLRFFGMLQRASGEAQEAQVRQHRVFDFIYLNSATVSAAHPFDVGDGETINCVFKVPEPNWVNIAGRIKGNLPGPHETISLMFQRDMGILGGVGGVGFPIRADGTFEGMLLRGTYTATINEMRSPDAGGHSRSIGWYGSAIVELKDDKYDVEISLGY